MVTTARWKLLTDKVLGCRWLLNDHTSMSHGVPDYAICTRPTVTGASVKAILDNELTFEITVIVQLT
jgi:hypothetical protein